jgi:hypothetical protein
MSENTVHFPFAPLKAWLDSHIDKPLSHLLSYRDRNALSRAQTNGRLTFLAADRIATAFGVHPRDIWDTWDSVSASESNPRVTEYDTLAKRVLKSAVEQAIEEGRPVLVYRKRKSREGYSRQTYCQEYIVENNIKAKAGCVRIGEEYHVYIFPLEVPATILGWPRSER